MQKPEEDTKTPDQQSAGKTSEQAGSVVWMVVFRILLLMAMTAALLF